MKHLSNHRTAGPPKAVGLTGVLLVLLLGGCVVTSVYPWYTAKEVVFDPALVGAWQSPGPNTQTNEFWQFEKLNEQAYKLTIADNDGKRTEFDAHLFKLGSQRFLDCLPRNREGEGIPPHYLLRVDAIASQLDLVLMDYDWLRKLVAKDPNAIRHVIVPKPVGESGDDLVLTANTAELQAFLRQHAANTNAFGEPTKLKRR